MINRYFQWIAGENKGEIATLEYIADVNGELYYQFTDGERCNVEFISPVTDDITKLKGKFMVEINSPTNPWEFYTVEAKIYADQSMHGETAEIPTLHDIVQGTGNITNLTNSDLGQERLRAPKKRQSMIPLPRQEEYPAPQIRRVAEQPNPVLADTPVVLSEQQQGDIQNEIAHVDTVQFSPAFDINNTPNSGGFMVAQQPIDPVKIFVDNCKKHETEVELSITIDLPSRDLFRIAASEFENGDNKFVDYVIQDLDINCIIDSLRDALFATYQDKNEDEKTEINKTEN